MKALDERLREIRSRPPSDDLVQDLFADSASSYMLICGRSGIGKTFLALNLLYCLATGTPFFSHKTKQCKVGYLSMEGSELKLANRFEIIGASYPSCNSRICWEHTTTIKLNPAGRDRLLEIITGRDVVLVDTLRHLVSGDYNKPSEAQRFIEDLIKLQNEASTRFILVHHIRKPDRRLKIHPDDVQFEVKGPTEYVDGATTVLLLERAGQLKDKQGLFLPGSEDNKTLFFAKVKDNPTDLKPITLHFNRKTLVFEPLTNIYTDEEEVM